jgi:uncharacterized protein with PIN domain
MWRAIGEFFAGLFGRWMRYREYPEPRRLMACQRCGNLIPATYDVNPPVPGYTWDVDECSRCGRKAWEGR